MWLRKALSVHNVMCINYRHVILLLDEMKVREDLVFDKNGEVVGYVDIGDINNKLRELERSCKLLMKMACFMLHVHVQVGQAKEEGTPELATHILCTMARGIFIKLEFTIAHFPTNGKCVYMYMYMLFMWLTMTCVIKMLQEVNYTILCGVLFAIFMRLD